MAKTVNVNAIKKAVAEGGCESHLSETYGPTAASLYVSLRGEAKAKLANELAAAHAVKLTPAAEKANKAMKAAEVRINAIHATLQKAMEGVHAARQKAENAAHARYTQRKVDAGVKAAKFAVSK